MPIKIPELQFPDMPAEKDKPESNKTVPKNIPESNKISISTSKKPQSHYTEIAKQDDKQIEAEINPELKAAISNEPFYKSENPDDNKAFYDIAYAGVMQLAHKQGNLILSDPIPEHTNEEFVYSIRGTNTEKNISAVGIGTAYKMIFTKEGKMTDKFARQKALSIATRNAYKHLLNPELVLQEFQIWYENTFKAKPDLSKIIVVSGSVNLKNIKYD